MHRSTAQKIVISSYPNDTPSRFFVAKEMLKYQLVGARDDGLPAQTLYKPFRRCETPTTRPQKLRLITANSGIPPSIWSNFAFAHVSLARLPPFHCP